MARPRKPTAALELAGAFKKDPKRGKERANEPKPTTKLGKPPEHLDELQKLIWDEMAAEGFWLTGADRFLFEVAVKLFAKFRLGIIFESKDASALVGTLNKLGFGPTERSKIKAPGGKEGDEKPAGFSEFK